MARNHRAITIIHAVLGFSGSLACQGAPRPAYLQRGGNYGCGVVREAERVRQTSPDTTGFNHHLTVLDPTPAQETEAKFRIVDSMILTYCKERNTLPRRLVSVLSVGAADPLLKPEPEYLLDGWGHQFRYRLMGPSYEIRSAGPDGKFRTGDDIVSAGPSLSTRRVE
jgi:hypothetical protein